MITVNTISRPSIIVSQGGQTNASVIIRRTGNVSLQGLNDVDTTNLEDGYALIYNSATGKFVSSPTTDFGIAGDYVANLTSGFGIDLANFSGQDSNITISLSNTSVIAGTYGGSTSSPVIVVDQQGRIIDASNASISSTLSIGANVGLENVSLISNTFNIFGSFPLSTSLQSSNLVINLSNSGVELGSYGGSSNVPSIIVDEFGRITSASNVVISSVLNIQSDIGSNSVSLVNDTLRFDGDGGISTFTSSDASIVTITNTGVISIVGSNNQILASNSNGIVSLSFSPNIIIDEDLTVAGNLSVLGSGYNSSIISALTPGYGVDILANGLIFSTLTALSFPTGDYGLLTLPTLSVFGELLATVYDCKTTNGVIFEDFGVLT